MYKFHNSPVAKYIEAQGDNKLDRYVPFVTLSRSTLDFMFRFKDCEERIEILYRVVSVVGDTDNIC